MRRLQLLIGAAAMLMIGGPILASPIACPATGDLSTLIGLSGPGGGCLINGLLFNDFTVTPSATGVGVLPLASQVTYHLDDPGISTGTGELIYGFEFNPNITIVGIGSEDVSLTYSIIAPAAEITSIHLLEVAVNSTGAAATVGESDRGCTGVGTGCVFLPAIQSIPGNPHQDLLNIGPYTEIDVFKDINVTSTSATGVASISQVRDSVDLNNQTASPEPASLSFMLGAGLIGLGYRKYRSPKSQSSKS